MGLQIDIQPNSPDNANNITPPTSDVPVDISPDKVPLNTFDTLLGRENGVGESYGIGVSNIARPYQSPNFKSGVSGWRLNSNGIIEAVGVVLSGLITQSNTLPVAQGGTGATTLTGILKGNGTSAFTAITPLAGTKVYYVADSSGGAVTRKLTFTDGILTSET